MTFRTDCSRALSNVLEESAVSFVLASFYSAHSRISIIVKPTLSQCWGSVSDAGPALRQRWHVSLGSGFLKLDPIPPSAYRHQTTPSSLQYQLLNCAGLARNQVTPGHLRHLQGRSGPLKCNVVTQFAQSQTPSQRLSRSQMSLPNVHPQRLFRPQLCFPVFLHGGYFVPSSIRHTRGR